MTVNPYTGFITPSVPACDYACRGGDPIDAEVHRHLLGLDREAASAMLIRRLTQGKYEIEDRQVDVFWGGASGVELVCCEARPGTSTGTMPLSTYLRQVAHIASEIRQPGPPRTLTFTGQGLPLANLDAAPEDARFTSMQAAVQQARIREETAEDCALGRAPVRPVDRPVDLPHIPMARPLPLYRAV